MRSFGPKFANAVVGAMYCASNILFMVDCCENWSGAYGRRDREQSILLSALSYHYRKLWSLFIPREILSNRTSASRVR
jgi:hypothetical protein